MIQITADQIERVSMILSSVPQGAEQALKSAIQRANSTVRSETLKGITSVYAISRQEVRAESTIKIETQTENGGVIGIVSFAGYKLPMYRFNVTPTMPGTRATVQAALMRGEARTPFAEAFVARMRNTHVGIFERKEDERLPIEEKMGLAVAQMAGNTVVLEQVEEKAQEVINKRIEHEITRILNGW